MILDPSHFDKHVEDINQLLWKEDLEVNYLQKTKFRKFNKEEILKYYDSIFKNFPMVIESATHDLQISIFATEMFELHYKLIDCDEPIKLSEEQELLDKRLSFNPHENTDVIDDIISTYFHHLVYSYDEFLKNTLKQHYFVGVDDEVKILISILKRYKSVLKDKTKQIDLFWCVKLNKQISDMVLSVLIEFIEHRLNLLTISVENIEICNEVNYVKNDIFGIEWNGSQQELCELILKLEEKGWIAEIKNGDRRKVSNSLTKIFNISSTKKSKKSNQNNSFYQLLKGEFDSNNNRIFPFMEKGSYEMQFEKINQKK